MPIVKHGPATGPRGAALVVLAQRVAADRPGREHEERDAGRDLDRERRERTATVAPSSTEPSVDEQRREGDRDEHGDRAVARVAKASAMSWLLSPSSARKTTPNERRNASTTGGLRCAVRVHPPRRTRRPGAIAPACRSSGRWPTPLRGQCRVGPAERVNRGRWATVTRSSARWRTGARSGRRRPAAATSVLRSISASAGARRHGAWSTSVRHGRPNRVATSARRSETNRSNDPGSRSRAGPVAR